MRAPEFRPDRPPNRDRRRYCRNDSGRSDAWRYRLHQAASYALRLRPVIAFDDDEIRRGYRLAQLARRLVIRRVPAVDRSLIRGKLDHRVTCAAAAFGIFVLTAPHQEPRAAVDEPTVALR